MWKAFFDIPFPIGGVTFSDIRAVYCTEKNECIKSVNVNTFKMCRRWQKDHSRAQTQLTLCATTGGGGRRPLRKQWKYRSQRRNCNLTGARSWLPINVAVNGDPSEVQASPKGHWWPPNPTPAQHWSQIVPIFSGPFQNSLLPSRGPLPNICVCAHTHMSCSSKSW